MEMERINDNLIKVTIDASDLAERDINFLDLVGDQHEIEAFFRSVLEEVDVDNQFKDSDAVTFQVIPTANGLELFISRADGKSLHQKSASEDSQEYFDDLLKNTLGLTDEMLQKKKARSRSKTEVLKQPESSYVDEVEFEEDEDYTFEEEVLHFKTVEDFIVMARTISHEGLITSLYRLNGEYFMILTVEPEWDQSMSDMIMRFAQILEFGDLASITPSVLKEHASLIKEIDALETFAKL